MNKRKGISLIILTITILVMIILAGIVIFGLIENNSLSEAQKAAFETSKAAYAEELNSYIANQLYDNRRFDKTTINATGKDMKEYISNIKNNHLNKFEIVNGELIYIGDNVTEENIQKGQIPIYTVEQFQKISSGETIKIQNLKGQNKGSFVFSNTADYVIMAPLDFSGNNFVQISEFDGTINFNNKKISNYKKIVTGSDTPAMFGDMKENGVIKNLILDNCYVSSESFSSIIATVMCGSIDTAVINNCSAIGKDSTGTLFSYISGVDSPSQVKNITLNNNKDSKISGSQNVGGIIGFANYVQAKNINVIMDGKMQGDASIGGVFGYSKDTVINDVNVNITENGDIVCVDWQGAGSIIGFILNTELESANVVINGSVQGGGHTGGAVGYCYNAVIKDINVDASKENSIDIYEGYLEGDSYAGFGGIVGSYKILNGKVPKDEIKYVIDNCKSKVNMDIIESVRAKNVYVFAMGGIVGYVDKLQKISNCDSQGKIFGMNSVGGIVGLAWHLYEMEKCMTHDFKIAARRQASGNTGCIVGMRSMSECYSDVEVTTPDIHLKLLNGGYLPNSAVGVVLGGIYGKCVNEHVRDESIYASSECINEATKITNCHAIGSIDVRTDVGEKIYNVGGFIGTLQDAIIEKCYAATPIISQDSRTGPFNGREKGSVYTVRNSYCSSEIAGRPMYLQGTNVSKEAMKRQGTFVGWDFENTWQMIGTSYYPMLRVYQK